MKLYSVLDVKAQQYGPIMALHHDAVAIREFAAAIDQPNSMISQYPQDFELHCVGTFEAEVKSVALSAAELLPVVGCVPVVVVTATALVASRASGPAIVKEA